MTAPNIPDEGLKEFMHYFATNYPEGCRIVDPLWHAPKLYRAAVHAFSSSSTAEVDRLRARDELNGRDAQRWSAAYRAWIDRADSDQFCELFADMVTAYQDGLVAEVTK